MIKIDWKRYPTSNTSNTGIYICSTCRGRGSIYDKWRKKIICPSCRGNKYLKECPKCQNMLQITDTSCVECILKLDNIEVI